MGSHTTYFCDNCNSDHDIRQGDDEGHAVNYDEYPVGSGWAEFSYPYTNSSGYESTAEINICAHCLANPEFEPERNWSIPQWDPTSQENFKKGRAHAETFAHALETLGTPGRWGSMRGVRQVFGPDHGQQGPKLEDGTWNLVPDEWEIKRAERDQARVDKLFAEATSLRAAA